MAGFAKVPLPRDLLALRVPLRCDYGDCYRASIASERMPNVDQLARAFFSDGMPAWVRGLIAWRDRIAARFDLKTADDFSSAQSDKPVAVGDLVGPWHVVARDEHEIVFRENDKHLDFVFSIRADPAAGTIEATTLVELHNALGRVYFFVIKTFHRLIVPRHMASVLRAASGIFLSKR